VKALDLTVHLVAPRGPNPSPVWVTTLMKSTEESKKNCEPSPLRKSSIDAAGVNVNSHNCDPELQKNAAFAFIENEVVGGYEIPTMRMSFVEST
jgi:hypothetical protein